MKNFTQKFIGLFALVFATSFTVNAQCDETLVLTSQGGNNNGSYGSYAWFANDLTLFVSNGDVIFDSNGTPYTVSGLNSEMGGSVTRIAFTSSVHGVFTNGNSYTSNIATCAIEGCTESTAQNYMPNANTDDGSCIVFGCMDISASTFNSLATVEDGSCSDELFVASPIYVGGWSSHQEEISWNLVDANGNMVLSGGAPYYLESFNFIVGATYTLNMYDSYGDGWNGNMWVSDFFETTLSYLLNYNNYSHSQIFTVEVDNFFGCTDAAAFNYIPDAVVDDGSCVAVVNGCLNELALNYNSYANTDDGSCIVEGCTDIEAFNYNEQATENDGSCVAVVNGCMDELACNYNSEANTDDSSCYSAEQYYDCNEVCLNDSDQDGVCDEIEVVGCTDSEAFNYNDEATEDDGSCVAVVNGCMDSSMSNYNSEANTDDDSCVSWEELANNLQFDLDSMMNNSGITQADLDAAVAAAQTAAAAELASVQNELMMAQDDVMMWQSEAAMNYDMYMMAQDDVMMWQSEAAMNYNMYMTAQADAAQAAEAAAAELAAAFADGVASVTPEDGVSQEDVDAAYAAGVASVEVPECEEVATQNMPLDLPQGWSMFGYTCLESLDVVEAFSGVSENIEIVKDEWGLAYLPAWGFSAFSNLEFGEGYQIKMIEEVTDFQFCSTFVLSSEEDGDPLMSFGYGTYDILNWTQNGVPGLPPGSSSYMNINSDAILTIDVTASFPDDQGELINVYQSLFANYESDFTDMIYITPSAEGVIEFSVTVNENSFTLSGTDNYGDYIVIEITPTTTIPGCMDPNNPAWNSEANKNDNSCLEGCFDTNACNYGEEGATECTYPVNECDCEGNGPGYANASFQINLNDGDFDGINNVELAVNLWEGESEMIIGLEDNNGDGIWEGSFDGAQGAMFDFVINVYGSELTTLSDCGGNPFVNGFPNPVADGLDVCNVWNNTIELNPFDCAEPQLQIGDLANGGIVFQINEDGSGLVADLQDLPVMNWYETIDAASSALSQGHDDWYLPSKEELSQMYQTIGPGANNLGGFSAGFYFSSTESSPTHVWYVNFENGGFGTKPKTNISNSGGRRLIRAF